MKLPTPPLKIREPQMSVEMACPAFDPSQLSDVPESETWREGLVSERMARTGVVTLRDGSRIGFTNGNLLRNRTYYENTCAGMIVWVTERGGISAHPPDTRSARQRYDEMLRQQVKFLSDTIDAEAIASVNREFK